MDLQQINRPSGQHLKPNQVDDMGNALLSLTRHVCVLTDRLAVLERVLDDNGIEVSDLCDTYVPDDALKDRISALTSSIIEDVVSDLRGR
ncbi:MAG: hypothetical protein AAF251_10720 [Pseudomonadota bacterium]